MRWRKLVLAVAIFFVALEVVLQLGALVAARWLRPPPTAAGASVLCLGDSYTFGIGASSPEACYPAQLQTRLRQQGHDVAVANGGCPGQDSAYMLRRLSRLLQPGLQVLCVMMGTNDSWSQPTRVTAEEVAGRQDASADGGGFALRWRTGRLLALGLRFATGSWDRSGDTTTDAMPEPVDKARRRDDLVDLAAGFQLLTANGVIPADPGLPALPPPCPPPLQQRLDAIQRLLAADATTRACELAADVAREHPDSPQALHMLGVASQQAGDAERAAAALARLQAMASTGDPAAEECVVLTLAATGRTEQTLLAARTRIAREPASVFAWNALQHAAFVLGDWDEFVRAAATTLRLAGRWSPANSAQIARNYAQAIAATDGHRAACLLVAATLLDGDIGLTRAKLRVVREQVPWAEFAAVLATVEPTKPLATQELGGLLQALYRGEGETPWAEVLREHLLTIGHLAKERGVRMVVLSYPFFQPEVEAVQRAAAAELGIPFVLVRERFDRELRTRARSDLFARDGHCNDAGYAILAELAAAAVGPLLTR